MAEPQRSPWWKRKRWIAAIVVWLVITYPLSIWPAAYAVERGWLPVGMANFCYTPVIAAAQKLRPHPGIGLGPANANGTRPYIILPDPDPWPRTIASTADRYLDIAEWFAGLGKKHAAGP
jgi:hypothetical protein